MANLDAGRQGAIISKQLGYTPKTPTVPVSLDGRNIEHFADPAEPDALLEHMAAALERAKACAEKASQIKVALASDVTLTEPARHLAIKQETAKAIAAGLSAIDAANDRFNTEVDRIRRHIAAPQFSGVVHDNFVQLAIVNRLAAMKPGERLKALSEALTKSDDRTLSVVLSSPPFVSGLSQAEHDMLRANYGIRRHAGAVKRIERLVKAQEALLRGYRAAESFRDGLYNQQMAREAEAAAERTRKALAKE